MTNTSGRTPLAPAARALPGLVLACLAAGCSPGGRGGVAGAGEPVQHALAAPRPQVRPPAQIAFTGDGDDSYWKLTYNAATGQMNSRAASFAGGAAVFDKNAGTRTFVGDFDGDGRQDLAYTLGPSIRAVCDNGTAFYLHDFLLSYLGNPVWQRRLDAASPTRIHTGNVNQDNKTDLVLLVSDPGQPDDGTIQVAVSDGTRFHMLVAYRDLALSPVFDARSTTRSLVGDFNGDRITDLALVDGSGPYGLVRVMLGGWDATRTQFSFSAPQIWFSDGWIGANWHGEPDVNPYSLSALSQMRTFVGDYSGDGKDDLLVALPNGSIRVLVSNMPVQASFFHAEFFNSHWVGADWGPLFASGRLFNINADGNARLDFGFVGTDGSMYALLSTGQNSFYLLQMLYEPFFGSNYAATALPTLTGEAIGPFDARSRSHVVVADMNGDGYDDLVITDTYNPGRLGQLWVAFNIYDTTLGRLRLTLVKGLERADWEGSLRRGSRSRFHTMPAADPGHGAGGRPQFTLFDDGASLVYDTGSGKCSTYAIPDSPARAVRTKTELSLVSTNYENFTLRGHFHGLRLNCSGLIAAGDQYVENGDLFRWKTWLQSPYALGVNASGQQAIVALLHHEMSDEPLHHPSYNPLRLWRAGVTFGVSFDDLYSFTLSGGHVAVNAEYIPGGALVPAHLVARAPSPTGSYNSPPEAPTYTGGFSDPTNLIEKDGYLYALVQTQHLQGVQSGGYCVIRAPVSGVSHPNNWRTWAGNAWQWSLASGATCTPVLTWGRHPTHPQKAWGQVCQAATECQSGACENARCTAPAGNIIVGAISYNRAIHRYLAVLLWDPLDGSGKGYAVSYSPDLVRWSIPQPIWTQTSTLWDGAQPGPQTWYPSFIDQEDASANFDRSDDSLHLYYVNFPSGNATEAANLRRQLVRKRVLITP